MYGSLVVLRFDAIKDRLHSLAQSSPVLAHSLPAALLGSFLVGTVRVGFDMVESWGLETQTVKPLVGGTLLLAGASCLIWIFDGLMQYM